MSRLRSLVAKAWALYRANGMGVLWRRTWRYVRRRGFQGIFLDLDNDERFQRWLRIHDPKSETLDRMRGRVDAFAYKPVIDVVMPVRDPELEWLEAAVKSVKAQVYPHWQLCVADDASTRPDIAKYLERLADEDSRIRVVRREVRGGISAATNAALTLTSGEFVCFLDHDDELTAHALYRVVEALNDDRSIDLLYSDECALELTGRRSDPFFKPDYSPDLLMSMNYIGHLVTCRRDFIQELGGVRSEFDGSQDYDLLLRLTECTDRIHHIPDILYLWRRVPGSSSGDAEAKPYALQAAVRALERAAERRGYPAEVTMTKPGRYRVRYLLQDTPLVSIVIPTRNRVDLLERCITSIREKTTYTAYEIIVMDNGSDASNALTYLDSLAVNRCCRVVRVGGAFNWSSINNIGARLSKGELLLFLNNDTEVLEPTWLDELVSQIQRPQVGAVGGKLIFPNGKIQHAGVVLGMGGVAGHAYYNFEDGSQAYFDYTGVVRNTSAVTGACMLTKEALFKQVGGFREELHVAYNDVDYCLRLQRLGCTVVWSPYATMIHHESASRKGLQPYTNESLFVQLWGHSLRDRYVNPNLDLDDVLLRIDDAAQGYPLTTFSL